LSSSESILLVSYSDPSSCVKNTELCSGTDWRDEKVQYREGRNNAGEDCVTYGFAVSQAYFKLRCGYDGDYDDNAMM